MKPPAQYTSKCFDAYEPRSWYAPGAGMSDYLVRQVKATWNMRVRLGTEIVGGGGNGWLNHLVLADRLQEARKPSTPTRSYLISCGSRARLIRVCRTAPTATAPTIAAKISTRDGTTAAKIPPARFDPIARWLPRGAPEDVAWTRNLPGAAICKLAAEIPSREPI